MSTAILLHGIGWGYFSSSLVTHVPGNKFQRPWRLGEYDMFIRKCDLFHQSRLKILNENHNLKRKRKHRIDAVLELSSNG